MALPLIGVGLAAAVSYITRMGAVKAAQKFTPALIKKAKAVIKKKNIAKEKIDEGEKKTKSKSKTEKDFGGTPLGQSKPKINSDSVKPKTYSYKHIDKYTRG